MSLRTPLGRVRGLGSAGTGTRHFWLQRLTALALVPLGVWFAASLSALAGAGYAIVTDWIGMPVVSILLVLFLGTLFYHLKLGLQTIVEDYVAGAGAKIALGIAINFACIALAFAAIFAVLEISLGS